MQITKLHNEHTALHDLFKTAWRLLKEIKIDKRTTLEQLPLYLLIGASSSGKTTLVSQLGLNLLAANPLAVDPQDEGNNAKRCNWWFSQEATLLDVPGCTLASNEETPDSTNQWQQFLSALQPYVKRKPLAGILLTLDLAQWGQLNKSDQQTLAQNLRQSLYLLSKQLKNPCPVYLILTKVDRIAGFNEFFADLDQEERHQPWGINFTEDQTGPSAKKFFQVQQGSSRLFKTEFEQFIKRLYDRVIWRLHQERNPRKRALIQNFPLQIETLTSSLTDLVYQLSEILLTTNACFLAGTYFVSVQQQGISVDYLHDIVTHTVAFSTITPATPLFNKQQSCFSQQLFKKVLFTSTANKQHFNSFYLQHRQRFTVYASIAVLLIASSGLMAHTLSNKLTAIESAQQSLVKYNLLAQQLSPATVHDLGQILPALNALQHATLLIKNAQLPWLLAQGWHQRDLQALAEKTYHDALVSYFLPNLGALLEQPLTNSADPTILYGALKTYLMLGDPSHFNTLFVQQWLTNYWQQTLRNNPVLQQQLLTHLTALLAQPITPLELNQSLVTTARNALIASSPLNLAYAILKNRTDSTAINPFFFTPEQAALFGKVFTSNGKDLEIPSLYTAAEFQNVYFNKIKNACGAATNGDWVLGQNRRLMDTQTLIQQVQTLYLQDYASHWTNLLANIQIIPADNWQQLNATLNNLLTRQSPFSVLLQTIATNTAASALVPNLTGIENNQLANIKTNLSDHFQTLNDLLPTNNNGPKTLDTILLQLTQLRDYLADITSAGNSDKAAFLASKSLFQAESTANPLQNLLTIAALAPPPIQDWLLTLANNSWRLLLDHTAQYLNEQWQNEVIPLYNDRLYNHYPLFKNASQDITLDDFAAFFSNKGVLANYFNNYLAPFIDTSQTQWSWRNIDGQHINLTPTILSQFERAAIIRTMFFAQGQTFNVDFSLRLVALEPGTSSFALTQNEDSFLDRTPSKSAHPISWPGAEKSSLVTLVFTDNDGHQTSTTEIGPWAIFKLLTKANLQATDNPQYFQLTFDLNGNAAQYQLRADQIINPFLPNIVDQFRCPTTLNAS